MVKVPELLMSSFAWIGKIGFLILLAAFAIAISPSANLVKLYLFHNPNKQSRAAFYLFVYSGWEDLKLKSFVLSVNLSV